VRNPSALLHQLLATAREEVRRTGLLGPAGQQRSPLAPAANCAPPPHNGKLAGGAAPGGGEGAKALAETLPDLHPTVRKAVREMVSQSCFEEIDFERAHVQLLAVRPRAPLPCARRGLKCSAA
jgi:hypothetical protein